MHKDLKSISNQFVIHLRNSFSLYITIHVVEIKKKNKTKLKNITLLTVKTSFSEKYRQVIVTLNIDTFNFILLIILYRPTNAIIQMKRRVAVRFTYVETRFTAINVLTDVEAMQSQ